VEADGLGVKDIRKFNGVLLAKWNWRFVGEEKGLWKDNLVSKYGLDSGRNQPLLKNQSRWWRDLSKLCDQGDEKGGSKKL